MNLKQYLKDGLLVLVGILLLVLGLYDLVQHFRGHKEPCDTVLVNELPDDVTAQVVVSNNMITKVTHTGVERSYVPSTGKLTITTNDSGGINVQVQTKGFSKKLGGDILYADVPRIGLDLQVAYWSRFGVHLGIGLGKSPLVVPFVGVSYRLDKLRLNNSSLLLGVTPQKYFVVGLRVEL